MRSAPPVRSRSIVAALAAALAIASITACAMGTSGADDDDQPVDARRVDARLVDARPVDAAGPPTDARPIDARPADAGLIDSGLPDGTCTRDADCPAADDCCLLGTLCGPDPGIPGFCTP